MTAAILGPAIGLLLGGVVLDSDLLVVGSGVWLLLGASLWSE